ncbi:MAG: hypothetical protein SFU87_09175 [Chitinophagaceae bacterium]|nr:hypothetical protein [Chitinophagaceae bacterium]
MKINQLLPGLIIGLAITVTSQAQNEPGVDSTGLPGDNFSLQGALQMFQKAASPEEFEKLLNAEDNHVNNLDLNGDGDIDYIRVIDKMDKDIHAFVLQAIVSEKESQDIAVIELEKTGDTTAILQIIGDEDIYGEQVIVEPDGGGEEEEAEKENDNENARGPYASFQYEPYRIVVNVWFWPSVRFVYAPVYRPWVSPWRWHYYPGWWRPWRPLRWHVWHPFRIHYHRPFVVVRTHRVIHAHRVYTPFRTTSVTVRTRHHHTVNNYRVNRTRTTVTGPRGNSVTRKTTTVRGPKGGVKVKKTTVRKKRG